MKKLLFVTGTSLLLSGAAFAQLANPDAQLRYPSGQATTSTESRTTTGGSAIMSDKQIVQELEQEGYRNVTVTNHNDKGHVDVMASKGGQNERLSVDPATGQAAVVKN
jgi:hypothetical protein